VNAVVPGACLGEFRHGTLVKKVGSGPNEVLEVASSSAEATDTHPGDDLVASCGSPVYTLADGLVVDVISDESDPDFRYLGYMVRIKHAATSTGLPLPAVQMKQTETLYLHLQDPPQVQVGDFAIEHALLGHVGRTGAAWGCHTHFEVRHFPGRYMTDPQWNSPPNIYGRGDQRANKLFKDSWTDPSVWLAKLPTELLSPQESVLELSMNSTSRDYPNSPTSYTDPGACPGEGCRYHDTWTMNVDTPVHPAQGSKTTSFVLKKGQTVTTLTGAVITKPGRIKIIHPIRISGQEQVQAGDLYVLTYRGEGFWKIWLKGKLIDSVALPNVVSAGGCKASDMSCKQKAEARWIAGPIWGVLEVAPQPSWWVQINDAKGRTGWIEVPGPTWASIHGEF